MKILLLTILLNSCQKEKELITGDVIGNIKAYSQYSKRITDLSGAVVKLLDDTVVIRSVVTSNSLRFTFDEVPYGRYTLDVRKEKFVPLYGTITVLHVGGHCPTYQDLYLYEVPTFQLFVDSIGYMSSENYFFLHFRPDTIYPTGTFRIFTSNLTDVSRDKYVSAGKGYLSVYYPSYPTVIPTFGKIYKYDFDPNIEKLKSDTIFLCIYPTAQQQGYGIMQFYPEALGKPSNVVRFLWNDLVQK